MIGGLTSRLPEAVALFAEILAAADADRHGIARKLNKLEREMDQKYEELVRKVADTFITPYDREDIYLMAEALDDVVDSLDTYASLIDDVGYGKLPDPLVNSGGELVRMTAAAVELVSLIKKPKKLEVALRAANECENQLDRNFRETLTTALRTGADPLAAIRLVVLANAVEDIATKLENFIRSVAIVAIKET